MLTDDRQMTTEELPRAAESQPRTGFSRLFVAGVALAMLLLGFGGAALVLDRDDAPSVPTSAPEEPGTAEEQESTPPAADPAEEPVAAVAEAVLPSVVQIQTRRGVGSGVIYDSNGLILTAAHVVAGEETVDIRLSDGTAYQGEVLGGDVATDVAVVSVDATDLPAAELALGEDVQVGQLAVAIGSPFGLDSTVTAGVVSAVNQTVGRGGNFQSLIQTDAAINPGNSGGALADRSGRVIGINVSIFSTSGGNIGVGFAVPIDVAHDIAQAVVSGETLERPVLGITGTSTESGPSGALVTGVVEGSGADEAGIQVGDVIIRLDGARVSSIGDLIAQVGSHRPGDRVEIDLLRGGEEMRVEAELGAAEAES